MACSASRPLRHVVAGVVGLGQLLAVSTEILAAGLSLLVAREPNTSWTAFWRSNGDEIPGNRACCAPFEYVNPLRKNLAIIG